MKPVFEVGITPDFYVDAQGKFEAVLEQQLGGRSEIHYSPMPPQPGKLATPESLQGVERPLLVARWGVGYDMIDVQALTEPNTLTVIFASSVCRG